MTSLIRRRFLALPFALALLALAAITITMGGNGTTQAASGEVVILSSSVDGGLSSYEADAVVAAGKTPVLKTPAEWALMTAADFESYDGVVLGDPDCTGTPAINIGAAEANALTWGPVINGNVIIIGSDPVYHTNRNKPVEAKKLIDQGIAFALAEPGKRGAYLDLSCYYHFEGSGTPVPVLDGIGGGGFTVIGADSLPGLNNVHIVATHPSLAGLTDADLSNWSNSVHEGFETWPVQFEALAIARDPDGSYTAPDGEIGYPYIIARGVTVISDISLAPESAINPVGTSHGLTATVTSDDPAPGSPVVGVDVTFEVIDGPHTGVIGVGTTDNNGQAGFSYVGTAVGVDTIQATFVDASGVTQRSNRVTKEWVEGPSELEVPVDIKPTSCRNPLNLGSKGVLPAAILGTADLDVTQVDVESIQLEGVSPLRWHLEDVATPFDPFVGKQDAFDCTEDGPDGFVDLTLKFDEQAIVSALGEVSDGEVLVLQLTGLLLDGTDIVGEDVVVVLDKGK